MFQDNYKKRINIISIIIIIVFILIIGKMFYLEVIKYNDLTKLANNLWGRNLPITADRGIITDRFGVVLANNVTTTSLVIIPSQIKDKNLVAENLSKILNVSKEEMLKHLNKKTSIERIHPEGRNLSYEVADKINDLKLEGVYLLKESKRNYPNNEMLSHVLGYVGIDNQGLSGIEKYYDLYLTGTNGYIKYYSDGIGNKIEKPYDYVTPTNGMNISLTIDIRIQESIERELDNAVSKYNPEQALIIVANPKTGEILGMASRPNFNPNKYKLYDNTTINRNLPIFNTYEPGSTFKVITLASSLEEKTIDLFEDKFYDSGHIKVASANIKCWKHGGHGSQNFLQVVENSCNPGFVVMGQKLGKERLMKYIKNFGFGEKTGIDLNGEENGILFKLENMGPIETATTAFGQGVSVTPIQQVMGVSAAINGGNLLTPYLVKSIYNKDTFETIKLYEPKVKRKVISEETSKLVRTALESVVAKGTGRNAYINNYRVGGKTGTAQKVNNGTYMDNNYILSFIGFMPADDPEFIIYVAIDNPKNVTQYGGTVSAPIAKSILEDITTYYDVKENINKVNLKEYEVWDTKYYEVPDVVGMELEKAKKLLNGFGVVYSGSGKYIVSQSPEPGEYIKETDKIRLMLSN